MAKEGQANQAKVLAILRRERRAVSAYELLRELRGSNPKLAPPTIYRALAALTERGLVHRVESMNAFTACRSANHGHASVLSICDDCGLVEESVAPDLLEELSSLTEKSGFQPMRHVIEVHGVCASCGDAETSR